MYYLADVGQAGLRKKAISAVVQCRVVCQPHMVCDEPANSGVQQTCIADGMVRGDGVDGVLMAC